MPERRVRAACPRCQATTPQLLTRLKPAPTFNDSRGEIEAHPAVP